jgi:DNA-binding MarR family transcriptional regulator
LSAIGKKRGVDIFGRNFVRDLIVLSKLLNEKLLRRNARRGHKTLRMAFAPVLFHISQEGTRAIDIAAKTDLSKQAIGKTVRELEQLGYIGQQTDASDARNKTLFFTPLGEKLLADTYVGVEALKLELETLIGKQKTRALIDIVALLVTRLNAAD